MNHFSPRNFMLLPTMACQASCSYCFAKKSGEVMSQSIAQKALDFIDRTAPRHETIQLTFHGGEPLLAGIAWYEALLPEIVARFGRRIRLSIQSNLHAMTDEYAELFRKYQLSVGTSVDGTEDICNVQRGENYYTKTKAGEAILQAHRIRAGEICTFDARHAHRAAEVFRAADAPYSIHGAIPALGFPPAPFSATPIDMTRIFYDSYNAYRADPAHCRISTIDAMAKGVFREKGTVCTFFDCLGVFAAIDPGGAIYSCQRFAGNPAYALGNVNDDPTENQLIQSAAYQSLHDAKMRKQEACSGCRHWQYCMGGCLYHALSAGTDKDPYCEAYRETFNRISTDMALEMGNVLLGKKTETPVLAMAGDRPHPFDQKQNAAALRNAVEKGRSPERYAEKLRDPYPEMNLNKLYLHLTFDCPLRCAHCYARGGERRMDELPPERFTGIVREAIERRFRSVVFTGGEPLVYPRIDQLLSQIQKLDRKGVRFILRSSFAFKISDERLSAIFETFDEIVVSVDGGRESHDARRGAGSYELMVTNLERAIALFGSEKIGLAATLSESDRNGEPVESVRALAHRLNIGNVRIRPILPLGRGTGAAQKGNSATCSEELSLPIRFQTRYTCGLGQNLYVEPDGSAYPCYAWAEREKRLGELSRENLGELLDRGELFEYCAHDVDTNEKCHSCEVRYLCGGICKAWLRDRENVDSGEFDCAARKEAFTRLAAKID